MGLIDVVGSVISRRQRGEVVYECRQCGVTLDGVTDTCPSCGNGSVARFEID